MLRRSPLCLFASLPVIVSFALAPACGPRKGPVGPTTSATVASATPVAPPATTPAPSGTATSWSIPGLVIPGLPASPRQALVGKWKVAGVDGKPVATAPGMATDPMDPTSYVAGSEVVFTADQVTLTRAGVSYLNRPYKVVQEFPPVRVTIDAGYGASNVDFALDGSAVWSLPSTPPHALSLTRSQ